MIMNHDKDLSIPFPFIFPEKSRKEYPAASKCVQSVSLYLALCHLVCMSAFFLMMSTLLSTICTLRARTALLLSIRQVGNREVIHHVFLFRVSLRREPLLLASRVGLQSNA